VSRECGPSIEISLLLGRHEFQCFGDVTRTGREIRGTKNDPIPHRSTLAGVERPARSSTVTFVDFPFSTCRPRSPLS